MTLTEDIEQRLTDRLETLSGLLGLDVADMFRQRPAEVAPMLAAQLTSDDTKLAAQTAIDLSELVDLDDPVDAASPLGVACALTFDHEVISQSNAAQLLGVSRSRVHALLTEGKLDRAGDNGVTRVSVARRLGRCFEHTVKAEAPAEEAEPVTIEDRIRAAYHQLAAAPGSWVSLTRLRSQLADLDRPTVDAELRRMEQIADVFITPEANQKALAQADRDAAVVIGGKPKHLIVIQGWAR